MELSASILEEPVLLFGHGGKHVDPKAGLALYGPAGHPKGGQTPTSITLGFVGSAEAVETAREWSLELNSTFDPDKDNVRLFPPFPGMAKAIGCRLVAPENLVYEIPPKELAAVLEQKSHMKRVFECSRLFVDGLRVLKQKAGPPNVVAFPWSEDVIEKCAGMKGSTALPSALRTFRDDLMAQEDQGQQRLIPLKPDVESLLQTGRSPWNLHAQMKTEAMEVGVHVQILEPRTYRGQSQLEDPMTLWNLATGLYYKAGGIPWRPAESEPTTCYIGIEFYRDKTSPEARMRTCLAQIFSDFGQGLVLRGSKFRLPTQPKWSPRMDRDTAKKLVSDAIGLYEKHNRQLPARVVIHKSSHFSREEKEGVGESLEEVEAHDLLTIIARPSLQFVRRGANPPLRGTMVELSRTKLALYTGGYIPYARAYPGLRIPRPLLIVQHDGPSGPQRLCNEILKLTKLNWNTARFSCSMPSTLMYAHFVKEVLAQTPEEQETSEDYASYM